MTYRSRIFSACAVFTLNGNFCVVQPNTVCRISHHFGPTGISHLKKESGFAYFMSNFARRRNECSNVGRMCLEGTGGSLNQQWQRIDMEMDDVELVEALEDLFQHEDMM